MLSGDATPLPFACPTAAERGRRCDRETPVVAPPPRGATPPPQTPRRPPPPPPSGDAAGTENRGRGPPGRGALGGGVGGGGAGAPAGTANGAVDGRPGDGEQLLELADRVPAGPVELDEVRFLHRTQLGLLP